MPHVGGSYATYAQGTTNQWSMKFISIFSKLEKTGIHFKIDVFAAVAVVDAKAPFF